MLLPSGKSGREKERVCDKDVENQYLRPKSDLNCNFEAHMRRKWREIPTCWNTVCQLAVKW